MSPKKSLSKQGEAKNTTNKRKSTVFTNDVVSVSEDSQRKKRNVNKKKEDENDSAKDIEMKQGRRKSGRINQDKKSAEEKESDEKDSVESDNESEKSPRKKRQVKENKENMNDSAKNIEMKQSKRKSRTTNQDKKSAEEKDSDESDNESEKSPRKKREEKENKKDKKDSAKNVEIKQLKKRGRPKQDKKSTEDKGERYIEFSEESESEASSNESNNSFHVKLGGKNISKKNAVCKICGTEFHTYLQLQSHIRFVHAAFAHKCVLCAATFTHSTGYYNHMKTEHPESERFPCGHPKCKSSFRTVKLLRNHAKSHLRYSCKHCKQGFGLKMLLMSHIENLHA